VKLSLHAIRKTVENVFPQMQPFPAALLEVAEAFAMTIGKKALCGFGLILASLGVVRREYHR